MCLHERFLRLLEVSSGGCYRRQAIDRHSFVSQTDGSDSDGAWVGGVGAIPLAEGDATDSLGSTGAIAGVKHNSLAVSQSLWF